MGADAIAPVIIKRKKVSGGDGHHGGAWKVAYADFVTAMMAFFMLMWLMGSTSQEQKSAIADYMNDPTASNGPGGAGKNRGGNGLRIGYRFLEPGEISIHDDRWLTYPWGANGGEPGARSRKLLQRADGTEELLPSKIDHVKVEAGDLLIADTWGGGGWGDPLERDAKQVAFDVVAGLVTVEGAKRYGVIVDADGNGHGDPNEGVDEVKVQIFADGDDPLTATPLAEQMTVDDLLKLLR